VLAIKNLNVFYGQILALRDVTMQIGAGMIAALIGANGAGKSTFLRTISGLLKPASGEITYNETNVLRFEAHQIVRIGIVLVPEGRRIFSGLTVYENLLMGGYTRIRDKNKISNSIGKILELFPVIRERLKQKGGTLSGGEQQMLAIGRALISEPTLLLLDEPSLGLAPIAVDLVFDKIEQINQNGTTVLLVEQNARRALEVASEGYILRNGEIVLHGPSEDLVTNPIVVKSYLGG
jgi:branched-chain amino acid transport system ATP-binding protein